MAFVDTFHGSTTREDYWRDLKQFDASLCEAMAVGQASSGREADPTIGYSTQVFARMCAHGRSLISACPLSRWAHKEFESWDVSAGAPFARAILEGYVLFYYLSTAPTDSDIQRAYVNVLHMYDAQKRLKILPAILNQDDLDWFQEKVAEIQQRLEGIEYFVALEARLKRDLLAGKLMMITPKDEAIAAAGIPQEEYDFFWNYLSQYTHILSFTFHRMEPNGRGTGVENGFDRDALCMVLRYARHLLARATERMVEMFPDVAPVRKGLDSKFSPGPTRNLPKLIKRIRRAEKR